MISSNGRFGNPKVRMFGMILEARRGDSQPFSLVLTYSPGEYIAQPNSRTRSRNFAICSIVSGRPEWLLRSTHPKKSCNL